MMIVNHAADAEPSLAPSLVLATAGRLGGIRGLRLWALIIGKPQPLWFC